MLGNRGDGAWAAAEYLPRPANLLVKRLLPQH